MGGISSTVFQPQLLTAATNGVPDEIAELREMLSGLSRNEGGGFVFDPHVAFDHGLTSVELLVSCREGAGSSTPAFRVCGSSVFETSRGEATVLINDQGTQYPGGFAETTLQVRAATDQVNSFDRMAMKTYGPVQLGTDGAEPVGRPIVQVDSLTPASGQPALSIIGPNRATCIKPDRIELLVDCGGEVLGSWIALDDGSTLFQATDVEAETVTETGGPFGPFPELPPETNIPD